MLNRCSIEIPETDSKDPRIAHLMGNNITDDSDTKVVLIGFPSDEGVRINGGRPGAAEAPDEIRKALYNMTPDAESYDSFTELTGYLKDVGNLEISGDLETDQQNMGKVIAGYLEQDIVPIILGGGHETAFAHFQGYAQSGLKMSIFNVDAHADVRPIKDGKAHSGSPFHQALEDGSGCAETYLLAGLQPHSVAKSHLDYITDQGGHYLFRDETNITRISSLFHNHESDRLMVTFDMDAVDQSQAPGVSAPCANGLSSDLWLTAAYLAGRNEEVNSFDISEVNPKYDRDGQTVKLAALTVWHFLLGLSQR